MSEAELEAQLIDMMQDALFNTTICRTSLTSLPQHGPRPLTTRGEVACSVLVLRAPGPHCFARAQLDVTRAQPDTGRSQRTRRRPGFSALRSGAAVLTTSGRKSAGTT